MRACAKTGLLGPAGPESRGRSGELCRDEAGERDPAGLAEAESPRAGCEPSTIWGPLLGGATSEDELDQSRRLDPGFSAQARPPAGDL